METKTQKNGKVEKTKKRECSCTGEWIFVPLAKHKRRGVEKSGPYSTKYTTAICKVKNAIKLKKPDTIEKAIEIALMETEKDILPNTEVHSIIPILKNASEIQSLVPLFNTLSTAGLLPGGAEGIMNAVSTTSKAKKDLHESKQWNGDIELCENLILKLHKPHLALYTKS